MIRVPLRNGNLQHFLCGRRAMELWAFVLDAAERHGLSDPDAARKWLESRPWGAANLRFDWWTAGARQKWGGNLFDLRNLACRLKGWKPRRRKGAKGPGASRGKKRPEDFVLEWQADNTLSEYLGMLRVAVPSAQGESLSAKTFRVGLVPTSAVGVERVKRVPQLPLPENFWLDDLDLFWQVVFYSLAYGEGGAFCAECGDPLPVTKKKGRPSRARLCAKCHYKGWRRRQSQESMRARWKEQKREAKRQEKEAEERLRRADHLPR
jgi:hypothetical protein